MNKNDYIEKLRIELDNKNKQIDILNRRLEMIDYSRFWKLRNKIVGTLNVIKKPKDYIARLGKKFKKNEIASNDIEDFIHVKSVYQDNIVYNDKKTDIKAIAFHLPQFHTFKENDEWWGKGFTEWTNTRKGKPRFKGHYQPRVPHSDIGYYDLSDIEALKKQAQLAKEHGIYGFCFYYYWFSGKRLMEKVVDQLLEHPEIDLPFCLCWANENWTRTWDGLEKSVLISQKYSDSDPKKFIKDIKKYINDKRYIRINGKPVILLYNPDAIPNVENVLLKWKKYAKEEGIGDIYIIVRNLLCVDKNTDESEIENCDAYYDFVPLNKGFSDAEMLVNEDGHVFDYNKTVQGIFDLYSKNNSKKPYYYTSMLAWDNSSRRSTGYNIFTRFCLEDFYYWNRTIIELTRNKFPEEERFMFINAWNEWCEGTYLEPDEKYGYASINTLSNALYDLPFNGIKVINDDVKVSKKFNKKIAVHVHLFHLELVDEIVNQLNNIPYSYDCFITTNTDEKKKKIVDEFKKKSNANKVVVEVTENRGRDVAPFLVQMSKYYNDYDYICHIHSKKSKTVEYGDHWRHYNYNNLFGSKENVAGIMELFENNKHIGMIYPYNFPVITEQTNDYGINMDLCIEQFKKLGIPTCMAKEKLEFAAGTMFWAKMDAIKPVFENSYSFSDFPVEKGQLDGTIAHALERTFLNLARSRGYNYVNTYNNSLKYVASKKARVLLYLVNDENINEDGIEYLNTLKKYVDKIVVVSSKCAVFDNDEIKKIASDIVYSDSLFELDKLKVGFKHLKKELKKYDELVITNDNCICSHISFDNIFSKLDEKMIRTLSYHSKDVNASSDVDFNYINTDFMIFGKKVINSDKIISSILNLEKCNDFGEVYRKYNKAITDIMNNNDIDIDVFIKETLYMRKYLLFHEVELSKPLYMMLLNSPIVNKKYKIFTTNRDKIEIDNFINQCK